jgi:hypothetical protein
MAQDSQRNGCHSSILHNLCADSACTDIGAGQAEENGVIVENVGAEAEEVNTIEDGETSPSAEPAQNGEPTEVAVTDIETENKDITADSTTIEAAYLPAQTFEAKTEDVKVNVEAEAGAFPAGTTMEVKAVEDAEVKTAIEEAIRGEVKQLKAVDITFKNADGIEIEQRQRSG